MFTTSRLSQMSQLHDDVTLSASSKIFWGIRGDGKEGQGHSAILIFFFFFPFLCPILKIFNWRAIYSGFFPCFPLCVMCFAGDDGTAEQQLTSSKSKMKVQSASEWPPNVCYPIREQRSQQVPWFSPENSLWKYPAH